MSAHPPDEPTYEQPGYQHLWHAYVVAARSSLKHPNATEYDIQRAADAYCKLIHQDLDPVLFKQLGQK